MNLFPWMQLVAVMAGGAAGSACRFAISVLFRSQNWASIPIATLSVNWVGSFSIGILFAIGKSRLGEWGFALAIPGFLGGFTTYSAFAGETAALFENSMTTQAILYVMSTTIGGLALAWIGLKMGRMIWT